ncbi:GntR family transcriptional regulator [Streptomyces sp. NPDC059631]|uniref:GntR family transcriptional regulator n=1 Tax=unclassified Streptomyces TaxID=2593676 RepID=UPI0036836F9C
MTAVPSADEAATEEQVATVRGWVRTTYTKPGTHLPAVAQIAQDIHLPQGVVRSALEQLAGEGLVTLHEGYRLYTVGTITPTERIYRLLRTHIHLRYEPGERFMNRQDVAGLFNCGGKEAAGAVRQLVEEGVLTGPRGQYVHPLSPIWQRKRARDLRARAHELRREALALVERAREIERELPDEQPVK